MQNLRRFLSIMLATLPLMLASVVTHAAESRQVALQTSMGEIVLELYPDKAPKTVDNFLAYVKSGHYNGTIFHRVIRDFMIQGGGFDTSMKQKPTNPPVQNEANNGLKNDPFTVAMARTAAPHSATAQFFINVNDNSFLDYPGQDGWGYTVFGKVVKGQDVVNKIKMAVTGNHGPHQNVPLKPIVIESASIIR